MTATPRMLEVAALFMPILEREEWKALRATCREARAIADRTVTAVIVDYDKQYSTPRSMGQLAEFVRGLLSRGATPDKLVLHLLADDGDLAEATTFEILSAVVSQQQQQPDWRGLTRLSLSNIPYTDALTSAVRSAAPHLAYLDVYSYDLDAATPGLCRLITTTAPSITSLTFGSDLHSVLPPLADAIATCIRLQHLQVSLCARAGITKGDTPMQASTLRVLELVRTLPTLRSLNLSWYAGSEFGPLLDVMSTLTQLTSLRLNAHSVAPGRVINTLRPLASLARLTLVGGTVDEAAFGALAVGHGQLTHLAFEDFQLLLDSTQAGRRSCVPLPAALRELLLGCNVKPRELLALQLPPSLTQLRVDGLQVSAMTHTDAETDAGEDAGGVLAASPSPCPGFDELLQAVGLLCGSYDAHELYLKYQREASPRTWPAIGDGNVRLFKALRPLGLRRLVCRDCALDLRDVAALAEHLPELQELTIDGEVHPAAVPLLACLPRLRHLELRLPLGRGADTWASSGTIVAAALAPLLQSAPSLKRLLITPKRDFGYYLLRHLIPCSQSASRRLVTTLREGVEWVKEQLRGMGREPEVVEIADTWHSLWGQE